MRQRQVNEEPALMWTGKEILAGRMLMPSGGPSTAVVIAALGGTSTHSGYREMARRFAEEGYAVLLADLLTADEQQVDSRTGHYRSNVLLVADRVHAVASWLNRQYHDGFDVVFFGSGITAAAGIIVACEREPVFSVLLLAGARVDLVRAESIATLRTPTLLLVPESDPVLLRATREVIGSIPGDVTMTVLSDESTMIEHVLRFTEARNEKGRRFLAGAPL